jgi:hypothetical protein
MRNICLFIGLLFIYSCVPAQEMSNDALLKDVDGHINYFKSQKNKKNQIKVSELFEDTQKLPFAPDSINKVFEIVEIEKLDSCYKKFGNIIESKDVYLINVSEIIDDSIRKDTFNILGEKYVLTGVYKVLSVCDTLQNGTKIEVGQKYKMLLISYFDKILPTMYHGENMTICLDNVCILHFPIGSIGNFYTSNLLNWEL